MCRPVVLKLFFAHGTIIFAVRNRGTLNVQVGNTTGESGDSRMRSFPSIRAAVFVEFFASSRSDVF
jgi:hypothetical protein